MELLGVNKQTHQPPVPPRNRLTESSTLETAAVILSIAMLTPTAEGTGPTACGPLNCGISKQNKNQKTKIVTFVKCQRGFSYFHGF